MPVLSAAPRACRLALPLAALALAAAGCIDQPFDAPPRGGAGGYLFCFWNTENFFDDKLNGWHNQPDKDFDTWFAEAPGVFQQKVQNLTAVLAPLNDGRGPDILALAELEAESGAARALLESLNRAIKPGTPPYKQILMKDPHGGRHIATALLTRLGVDAGRTQLLGRRQRMLETHVSVRGHDLVVLATHWTSRVSDQPGAGREKYADVLYGRFLAMYKADPKVDVLICGDFNDNPDDPSVVQHLHATGDLAAVRKGGADPLLYNVFANLWQANKERGTVGSHFYHNKGYLFDQVVVSPGLVDNSGGWQCEIETARIVTHQFMSAKGHPYAFGTARDKTPLSARGVSDHLPVTVRLRVGR